MAEWVFINKHTEAIKAGVPDLTDEELLADAIREYEKHTGKKYDDNSSNPRR
jgi:hypothetical protein